MFNFNIDLNVQFQHKIWMFNFKMFNFSIFRMLHQFLTTRASSNFILLLFSSFRAISMSLISWSFSSLFSIHICVQTRVKASLKVKLQTLLDDSWSPGRQRCLCWNCCTHHPVCPPPGQLRCFYLCVLKQLDGLSPESPHSTSRLKCGEGILAKLT